MKDSRNKIAGEKFVKDYFKQFNKCLNEFLDSEWNITNLVKATDMLKATEKNGSKIILIGNGGSAAIAEHMAIDLTKNAGLRAIAFSGTPLFTAFSNDFGHEKVFQKYIEIFTEKDDLLIAISSSGRSRNILNACKVAREKEMKIITFSGFGPNNPLRKLGNLNFWVDSKAYGYVEISHNLLIHCINDMVIGSAVYKSVGEKDKR